MMQDRPDLIQRCVHVCRVFIKLRRTHPTHAVRSELAGLAFDSLQQVFRKGDIKIALSLSPLAFVDHQTVFVIIDPVIALCASAHALRAPTCVCDPPA